MGRRMIWSALGAAVAAFLAAEAATAQSFCRYEITAIIQGPPCGVFPGYGDIAVLGINDYGQVTGYVAPCLSNERPFVWTEEHGLSILPMPPGAVYILTLDQKINNVLGEDGIGQIMCTMSVPGLGSCAALFDDGAWTLITPTKGGAHYGRDLNDLQQVCGTHWLASTRSAFRWEDGSLIKFAPQYTFTEGYAINTQGEVAGTIGLVPSHVMWWDQLEVHDLGLIFPDATGASPVEINSDRQILGNCALGPITFSFDRAFLWSEEGVRNLTPDTGWPWSAALDLNDLGQAVVLGYDPDVFFDVMLWQNGHAESILKLLASEPPNQNLSSESWLNNRGQIATGFLIPDDGKVGAHFIGAVLKPVDRPLGDVNRDCTVDSFDVLQVLRDWGSCAGVGACPSDIVTRDTFQSPPDGNVDAADLAAVLGNWTIPVVPESRKNR